MIYENRSICLKLLPCLKLIKPLFFLLVIISIASCKEHEPSHSESTVQKDGIDQYVNHIIERHEIPGISLTIVKDGEIIHKANYGNANVEHNVPITDQSIFRVYSLTKLIVSVGVFQLIEQGKLSWKTLSRTL